MRVSVYVDGGTSSKPHRYAVSAVVVDPVGRLLLEHFEEVDREATCNVVEYEALRLGIRMARLIGAEEPHFVSDSKVVVSQVAGWWAISSHEMSIAHGYATSELMAFPWWSIQHVLRDQNARADWLCCRALGHQRTLKAVPDPPPFRCSSLRPGWANIDAKKAA
jgi:ribonuclease HI